MKKGKRKSIVAERRLRGLTEDIVRMRRARGWTQREAARRLGLAQQIVCRVEAGRQAPGLRAAVAYEHVFGIRPAAWVPSRHVGGAL